MDAKVKHFIGCDVSKDTLDFAVYLPGKKIKEFPHTQKKNNKQGFVDFRKWLKSLDIDIKECVVALENTGLYGEVFTDWLWSNRVPFVVLNAAVLKKSYGAVIRGKADKIDAQRIADYLYTYREQLKPSEPTPQTIRDLRALRNQRKISVKQRAALRNQLHTQKKNTIAYKRTMALIKAYDANIEGIEADIETLIGKTPEIEENYKRILTIPGVGPVNAVNVIIATANFTIMTDPRQFAAYACVAPYPNSSGTSVRNGSHVSKFGDRMIKADLSQAAHAAVTHKGDLKKYFDRKIGEGKNIYSVLNAVKFKIILRIFAVVKRKSDYVETIRDRIPT